MAQYESLAMAGVQVSVALLGKGLEKVGKLGDAAFMLREILTKPWAVQKPINLTQVRQELPLKNIRLWDSANTGQNREIRAQ